MENFSHTENQEAEKTETATVKRILKKLREYSLIVLIALLLALIIKTFFLEAYRIPTASMENTLLAGDFILVNKIVFGITTPSNLLFTNIKIPSYKFPSFRKPKRGDVIVFRFPGNRDELYPTNMYSYIKRVVAEPGDKLQIINKTLYVNDKLVQLPDNALLKSSRIRIPGEGDARIFPKGANWNEDFYGPITVPKKGMNVELTFENLNIWQNIIDRENGKRVVEIQGNSITTDGSVVSKYTIKKDYYFVLGDNRDDSMDSRFWGFVPEDFVIGKAELIYWSYDEGFNENSIFKILSGIRIDRIISRIK